MKNLKTIKLIILSIFLAGCNESIPQNPKDLEKLRDQINLDNLKTMFLGTINLCSDTDYSAYLDNPRSNEEYKKGGNCCSASVPKPYISLAEYYIYAMEGDRSIFDNQNNPFKLKEIREDWKDKVEEVKEEAQDVNSNNLTYKGLRNISVSKYDMATGKLKINQGIALYFSGGQGSFGTLNFRYKNKKKPVVKDLDISEEEAKKLFDYYEENRTNPQFPLVKQMNTIITYAIEKPDYDHRTSWPVINIKKVEFYYPDGWDKKIGEVIFDKS
ncbi:MAG: hypothetical protein AAFX55_20080 [Bacteroidota bacterium]